MQLVDTNVISELLRPRPKPSVTVWLARQAELAVAAISVDESIYGLTRNNNPALLDAYRKLLQERFNVLPLDQDIATRAGQMRAGFSVRGITRSQPDMLIAATAQAHNLTLVTRNIRDFENCGIALLNPFID